MVFEQEYENRCMTAEEKIERIKELYDKYDKAGKERELVLEIACLIHLH